MLGFLTTIAVALPGLAYLFDPLRRRNAVNDFVTLPVSLKELRDGVPRSFPIVVERQDAWVKYPPEPIGTVWLIRQPASSGSEGGAEVIAFTAECPHLGCAIGLAGNGEGFFCPCHQSAFTLAGVPTNEIPPRPMDRLEVEPISDPDKPIRVRFQRFRTQTTEKVPLA